MPNDRKGGKIMITNIKLTKDDKKLLKSMKEKYNCEINIKPGVGIYVIEVDNFEILSSILFILLKMLETEITLTDTQRNILATGFGVLKERLNIRG